MGVFSLYFVLFFFTWKTLARNSEWSGTESLARSGVRVNPGNAKVHLTLGNILAEKGLRSCEKHYREALRLRPNYTLALGNLGLVLLNTGRAEEAERNYRRALTVRPFSGDINSKLAHLLRVGERYEEAEEQYRKAISIAETDPFLYYHFGYVLEKTNKFKEALGAYQMCTELQPNDGKAYLAMGRLLSVGVNTSKSSIIATGKRAKRAELSLRKGLSLSPSDNSARLLLGRLLLVNSKLEASEKEFRQILQQDINNSNALFFLAQIHETRGHLKEAGSLLKRCLEINPQFKEATVAWGRIKGAMN